MRSFISVAALALVATTVACSASSQEGVGSSESNATEAKTLEVVKGREYARCWFDTIGQNAQLSCTSTARGKDPIAVKVEVLATAMVPDPAAVGGLRFTNIGQTLDIEAGATVVVGSLPLAAFPLMTFWLQAQLPGESLKALGETKIATIYNHVKVTRPGDLTPASPAILKQPYDLWPVAFLDARPFSGYTVHAEYTRSIAPYVGTFETDSAMTIKQEFFASEKKGQIVWFVAPESGKLDLRVQGAGKENVTLTGPGYYISTSDDFRLATPGEASVDFPGEATTNTPGTTNQPGTGTTTAPTPEPTPEPATDPTPGCGADGEKLCQNPSSCDDGARYDSSKFKCVACGEAGQTLCYKGNHASSAEGTYCNAGTRYDSSKYQCVPCGEAGQTLCYKGDHVSSAEGTYCNAGTRYDSSKYQCVPCGGEGQTYCYSDPDGVASAAGTKCNDGLRYSSSSYKCVKE